MNLPIEWTSEGAEKDSLVFATPFKIHRGRAPGGTKSAAHAACFGVRFYHLYGDEADAPFVSPTAGAVGVINQVIAPLLPLRWARVAVEILEQGLIEPDWTAYERVEVELRRRGYDGVTIAPFYMPDTIGFYALQNITGYAKKRIEELAEEQGVIERILTDRGYSWIPEKATWLSPNNALWDHKLQEWNYNHLISSLNRPVSHPPTGKTLG